jgi:PAS domain S-box-containing protein
MDYPIPNNDFNSQYELLLHCENKYRNILENLLASELQYRRLFESAKDGILILDAETGMIKDVNPFLINLLDYTKEQFIEKTIWDIGFFKDIAANYDKFKELQKKDYVRYENLPLETAKGRKINVEFVSNVYLVNGKRIIQCNIRDITESKRAEKELIESKEKAESASKLKDAFIANISHEIRTPLNGIMGMASLIRDVFHDKINEEEEKLFNGIAISSKRIMRTVDMILNYSRLQVGEFPFNQKKINLSLICEDLVRGYSVAAKFKSLELNFRNICGNIELFADEYTINMAISNLVDNAIKYTNQGTIDVILHRGINNDIILDVKDTGIGISKEFLENMFEPYLQEQMGYLREYEGAGLGLSIVKKIMNINNFALTVESKKGEGSTFTINFRGEN